MLNPDIIQKSYSNSRNDDNEIFDSDYSFKIQKNKVDETI